MLSAFFLSSSFFSPFAFSDINSNGQIKRVGMTSKSNCRSVAVAITSIDRHSDLLTCIASMFSLLKIISFYCTGTHTLLRLSFSVHCASFASPCCHLMGLLCLCGTSSTSSFTLILGFLANAQAHSILLALLFLENDCAWCVPRYRPLTRVLATLIAIRRAPSFGDASLAAVTLEWCFTMILPRPIHFHCREDQRVTASVAQSDSDFAYSGYFSIFIAFSSNVNLCHPNSIVCLGLLWWLPLWSRLCTAFLSSSSSFAFTIHS